MRPRFPVSRLGHWAGRAPLEGDDPLDAADLERIRRHRFLRKADLVALARWKTPRSAPRVAQNQEEFVVEVTRTALTTPDERQRIESLTRLSGVGWPTASVILHFCHGDPYPILDTRALWSLGVATPPSAYGFDLWSRYTQACRRLAVSTGCSMRTLDRALWQYSKERQARRLRVRKRGSKKIAKRKPASRANPKKTGHRRRKPIMRHSREG